VTYIPTDEGWLYLASVIELASRHLLGYSMGTHHNAGLVCDTLDAAVIIGGRQRMDGTIFHTDRGSEGGFNWSSMRWVGDSLDNALAENLFSTLKVELVYRTSFRTREEAELALFRYVDGWYNPHRIQKALGWRSPDEYEADYDRSLEAATPAGTK
jgi:putative transposase